MNTETKQHRPIVALGRKEADETITITDVLCANFPDMTNAKMAELSSKLEYWGRMHSDRLTPTNENRAVNYDALLRERDELRAERDAAQAKLATLVGSIGRREVPDPLREAATAALLYLDTLPQGNYSLRNQIASSLRAALERK